MATVKYIFTNSGALNTVTEVAGQIIVAQDTSQLFIDTVTNNRVEIGGGEGIQVLAGSVAAPGITTEEGVFYYTAGDNALSLGDDAGGLTQITTLNALGINFTGSGFTATNVQAAILELAATVDAIPEVPGQVLTPGSTLTAASGGGVVLTEQIATLSDGSTSTGTSTLTLAQMGAASITALETLSNSVDGKVDTATLGLVVQSTSIVGAVNGGLALTVVTIDPSDGATNSVTTTLAPADLQLATEDDVTDLQSQIDTIRGGLLRFEIDFEDIFGTATPTMAQANTYLSGLGIIPAVGTALKNNNAADPTYQHVFTYYIDETVTPITDPPALKLVDDGVDSVTTATSTNLGVVMGAGDISVDVNGNMHITNGSVTLSDLATALQTTVNGAVQNSTTINGHDLTTNITLNASDIPANPIVAPGDTADPDSDNTSDVQAALTALQGLIDTLAGEVSNATCIEGTPTDDNFAMFSSTGTKITDSGVSASSFQQIILGMDEENDPDNDIIGVINQSGQLVSSGQPLGDIMTRIEALEAANTWTEVYGPL